MLLYRLRNRHVLLLDLAFLMLAPALALALRLDLAWRRECVPALLWFTLLALAVKLPVFFAFGLYNRLWRYASMDELNNIVAAVGTAGLLIAVLFLRAQASGLAVLAGFPRSVPFLDAGFTLLFAGGLRFGVRLAEHRQACRRAGNSQPNARRVLIVGAGSAGALLVRQLLNSRAELEPAGFVDDDPGKRGLRINGVAVLGPTAQLAELARATKAQEVLIAMPSAPGKTIREIVEACRRAGLPSRTLPGLSELVSGRVDVSHLRPVTIEDLLRREPVQTDLEAVRGMLAGRRVLVTGAGGSIGSELCRQIGRCGPAATIALGHGENSLFELSNQLCAAFRDVPEGTPPYRLELVVADVRDRPRLEAIFERFRPEVVFHAAAHKHVPMMESNAEEAVTNNVFGTRNVVEVAAWAGAERFVFISSDKAVNPSSVMGATKRIAELLVAQTAVRCGRPYVSVRFGNVLGSRGSVLPLFRQQLAEGGPLTVTHPGMMRYFMTIPEAVQLVLQAAVLGTPGNVFVLDMGQPVKMVDLAEGLVKLSGLELGRDIDIVYTGVRPGEKLFEELFGGQEQYERTVHGKIFVAGNGHQAGSALSLDDQVDQLIDTAQAGWVGEARGWLKRIVPEYQPPAAAEGLAAPAVQPLVAVETVED